MQPMSPEGQKRIHDDGCWLNTTLKRKKNQPKKPFANLSPFLLALSESEEMTIAHNTELNKEIIGCLSQRAVAHSCQTLANFVRSI